MKKIYGDLLRRILLNRKRMSDDLYRPNLVFTSGGDWPGDFEGRAILSLCSLFHALDGYPKEQKDVLDQLEEIFSEIHKHTNSHYYFGDILNDHIYEQQISGNSWYLRGLVSYYQITKQEKYLEQIKKITEQFLVKLSNFYDDYPTDAIREDGGVGGHTLHGSYGSWYLSSDVGCAFIMLDGASAVYEIYPHVELKKFIEKMIEMFSNINFIKMKCQTHAVLSCARGIFRFYKVTQEKKYLELVEDIFKQYLNHGMTLDYSNINWFSRPDTWTEPCCIIDSLLLSKQLYLETAKTEYLRLFNRIYVNTLRTFQRDNGGAGCSTCATNENQKIHMHLYEAYFCCTMRFAEGLFEIADFSAYAKDNVLYVPFNADVEYDDGKNHFVIHNDIYENRISFDVIKAENIDEICLYIPNNADCSSKRNKDTDMICMKVEEGRKVNIDITTQVHKENDLVFCGDMLYTIKEEQVENSVKIDGKEYSPLYDSSLFSQDVLKTKTQYAK